MLPEPYDYVRAITMALGALWTIGGARRLLRFAGRWEARLEMIGLTKKWLRHQVWHFTLRVTVLDPINLALFLLLLATWSARRFLFAPPS